MNTTMLTSHSEGPDSRQRFAWPLAWLAFALTVAAVSGALYGLSRGAEAQEPTFGRMPESVMANGRLDLSNVPDFVQTEDHNGRIVGYVRASDLFAISPEGDLLEPTVSPWVYARDGKTVVGRMVSGVGFVASGDAQDAPPGSPPTTSQGRG